VNCWEDKGNATSIQRLNDLGLAVAASVAFSASNACEIVVVVGRRGGVSACIFWKLI
jgi:hypothetical protein